jgi:hypothetical protein
MHLKPDQKPKQIRWIFYSIWILMGLFQAVFTEISSDEAYYWRYAQNLQWGYFDHPPVIAVLIKMGGLIFNGVLGVRLMILVLNTATIFLLEKLSRPTNILTYYLVIASLAVFHLGGILAIPDSPLLFFAVVYLLIFERFLNNSTWTNTLLLALSAALMLYSKYHGVLVIGFSVLVQPRLLLNPKLYVAGLLAAAFMIPHLYWQYENHWPSVSYHLSDRSVVPYQLAFTLEYLLYTFLLQGPIIAALLYFNVFKKIQAPQSMNRSLQFVVFGVIGFFLLSSFKGRVEPHWTLVCAIPLVALFFRNSANDLIKPKTIKVIFLISLALILPARALLMAPLDISKSDYHNWKKWVGEIEEIANGTPVVIMNSYQKAAKYEFYSGKTGHSHNNIWYRRNQYDLWHSEEKFWSKRIFFLLNNKTAASDSIFTSQGKFYYEWVDDFASYTKVRIEAEDIPVSVKSKEDFSLNLRFDHNYDSLPNLQQSSVHPTLLSCHLFSGDKLIASCYAPVELNNKLFDEKWHPVKLNFEAPPGEYHLILAVQCGWMPATINSKRYGLVIAD